MAPLTISVPILGAVTGETSLDFSQFIGLGLVGLCAHCFGFALNDLIDLPVDRQLALRQSHPLITGALAKSQAWIFTLLQIPLALVIYLFWLHGSIFELVLLCTSVGLSVAYNLWGKQNLFSRTRHHPPPYLRSLLAEISLAVSVGLLCLVGVFLGIQDLAPRPQYFLFPFTLTLILLVVNSVPSGLKDLQSDAEAGAVSFALAWGNRVSSDDRLLLSQQFKAYVFGLLLAINLCLLALIALFRPPAPAVVIIVILAIYAALHLRMLLSLGTFKALRGSQPLLSGYYHYAALALTISGLMPLSLGLLYGALVLLLLAFPWTIAWRLWRARYQVVRQA